VGYGLQATHYRFWGAALLCCWCILLSPARATAESPVRLTSVASKTWIWAKPATSGRFLGYMRIGQSVALSAPEPVRGVGCPRGFYRVEPRGYVCHDRTVTLGGEPVHRAFLRANAHTAPRAGAFPYEYALSNGAPMYSRLPSEGEQRRVE
jgi:hypothetical protein